MEKSEHITDRYIIPSWAILDIERLDKWKCAVKNKKIPTPTLKDESVLDGFLMNILKVQK